MVLLKDATHPIGDNWVPKKSKNQRPRVDFVNMWGKLTASDLDSIRGKEAFYYILNAILYLLCPVCKIFKEATTDNFTADHVSCYNAKGGWINHFPHSFKLGSFGCNQCWAQKIAVRQNDTDGNGYIRAIMSSYPQLYEKLTVEEKAAYALAYKARTGQTLKSVPQTDGGVRWYTAQLGKECWATGFTMLSKPVKGHPFNPSPNGLDIQEDGYSQKKGHAPERTVAVCAFVNVQQGATNIPNLREAYITLYETMVADWLKTPEERETEEDEVIKTIEKPFPKVIKSIASHSLGADIEKGRECDLRGGADVVVRLKAVRMRCHTSGVLLSPESGWNKVHADRIDNARGHVDGNIEWKCALFNNQTRLTREQFLQEFLKQPRVAIPDAMRAELERKLRLKEVSSRVLKPDTCLVQSFMQYAHRLDFTTSVVKNFSDTTI